MQFIDAENFLKDSREIPIVDVRSPGEFAEGHIPSAINMPIFNDGERAVIGTIYKNKGRQPAIETGLEITGPKMAEFVRKASGIALGKKLLVHCWRGGMRSESMAWLYERMGIDCAVLKGGYKAYRNYLLEEIKRITRLTVIEGPTGCGKTEIIQNLKDLGEQVIDLEGLAHHKGSVFGGIAQEVQPTTQQFQNNLFGELLNLDWTKRIFVEGESQTIGRVYLPDPFWEKMNDSTMIEIDIPRQGRVKRLIDEYGDLPMEEMEQAINSLSKRIGEVRKNEILSEYREGKLASTTSKLLDYYDKSYQYSTLKYRNKGMALKFPNENAAENARILLKKLNDNL